MNIAELVSKTVATGVAPLELSYRAVNDCSKRTHMAYRAEVVVNSIELGCIRQSEFSPVSDSDEVGIRLSEWAIAKVLQEVKEFKEAGKRVDWVSVMCPVAYAELPDFYDRVKKLVKGARGLGGTKLCLEFNEKLLSSKAEVRRSILDLKLLGVYSLLAVSQQDTCPFFRLTEIPVDKVVLSKNMSEMIDDRNKPEVVSSLIKYLGTMHTKVIVDGALSSDQIRSFERLDCEGYLLTGEKSMNAEEVIFDKEETV